MPVCAVSISKLYWEISVHIIIYTYLSKSVSLNKFLAETVKNASNVAVDTRRVVSSADAKVSERKNVARCN